MNYLKIRVFVNSSLSAKSWPAVIQKLGGTSPRVEREREEYLGVNVLLRPVDSSIP